MMSSTTQAPSPKLVILFALRPVLPSLIVKSKRYPSGRLTHYILYLKRIGFNLIDCFEKVSYLPKYSTMHLSISNSLSQMQWVLKFFQSSSRYSNKRPTFVCFGRLLESATWRNCRTFSNLFLLILPRTILVSISGFCSQ